MSQTTQKSFSIVVASSEAKMANEIVIQWNSSPTPVSGYNVYRGTLPGNEGSTPYNVGLVTVAPNMVLSSVAPLSGGAPYTVTSVATSTGGTALYTGTFANGAANALAGKNFTITGFTNAVNNGTFLCTGSTILTIILVNTSATAETATAFASQVVASGSAVYIGNVPGGASSGFAGFTFVISGYSNAANNGKFNCVASTATSLTLLNANSIAETHNAIASQVPQFTDIAVFPGKVYSYEVTAVAGGIESADSIGILSAAVPFGFTPIAPELGTLDGFVILAATAVTNTGATTASGDVGVYPGTSITGFGAPAAISGVFHLGDFVAAAAQGAAQQLYNTLQTMTVTTPIVADLGGQTLVPGVYNSGSSIGVTGTLTLDGGGNPNAVWIFQAGSSLTFAANTVLINGAQAANVFWVVGSSASIAANNIFAGTIVAQASITVQTGAQIAGRLLALGGAITLIDDTIILFNAVPFAGTWLPLTNYGFGLAIFDCGTDTFQRVLVAGISSSTRPNFSAIPGAQTTDGSVVWEALSPASVILQTQLPPSPPNVPPSAPAAPTGLIISLEN
jgi:hypothetical protein